jgi:hypothetical protein
VIVGQAIEVDVPLASKQEVARAVVDIISSQLQKRAAGETGSPHKEQR